MPDTSASAVGNMPSPATRPEPVECTEQVSRSPLRYVVLATSILMLVFLGTGQAFSVYIAPLKAAFGYSDSQLQFIFTTGTVSFCLVIIVGGRLQDRFGPRPLAVISALLMAGGWTLAAVAGSRYLFLWLGLGVVSAASAMAYVCPVATAIKWFPHRAGLIAGLAAAGFGAGPILLSNIAEWLLRRQWPVLNLFGLLACVWAPIVLISGLLLFLPPGHHPGVVHAHVSRFRRRALAADRRFWTLVAGMFFGTLPYLVVMGSVKPLGTAFGIGQPAAAAAISIVAAGNTGGRIFWGHVVDGLGARRSMRAAQALMVLFLVALTLAGRLHPFLFLASVCGIGFCYGSNFAIQPSTVSRLYGTRLIGSVYPLLMTAQGVASLAATANGLLHDRTGSYLPGLLMATALAAVGFVVCSILSRTLDPT